MKDPGEISTLGKLKKLEADLSSLLVPESKISHPKVVSDSATKRLITEILSRNYVDMTFDCVPVNARRVLSSLCHAQRSLSFSTSRTGQATPTQLYATAEMILDDEMGFIDTDCSEFGRR